MAAKDLGPLTWDIPIVDTKGRPSPEFQRRWNTQRSNNAGAVTQFTQLTDVPASYATKGGYAVRVKAAANGLEFVTQSTMLDGIGLTRGAILERGASGWQVISPGAAGTIFASNGAGADPAWATVSAAIDAAIGSTRGAVLYRGAAGWAILAPGTAGNFLQTAGAGADPLWAAGGAGGGGLFTPRPPTLLQFALTNAGTGVTLSATAGTNAFTLKRTDTGAAANERVGFQGKAVPAGASWTADAIIQPHPAGKSTSVFLRTGLGIVENATGKTIALVYNTQGFAPQIDVYYFSNLNTFGSTISADTGLDMPFGYPLYLRIAFASNTYTFSASYDYGVTYDALGTATTAGFFTADRIGLVAESFATYATGQCRTHCLRYSDPDIP